MDSNVTNLRLIGGYKVNENISLEIGYLSTSDFKWKISGADRDNVKYYWDLKGSYSGFDIATILRPSVASGYNNLFVTVGFHNYEAKASGSLSALNERVNLPGSSENGTGMLFGGGYDFNLQEGLDLRATVTRLNKLAGDSDDKATNFGVTLIKHF